MFVSLATIIKSFSRSERVVFWAALASLLLSIAALLWLGIYKNTILTPAPGGEYTEGIVGQPTSINPILASTEADRALVNLLFADLITLTERYTTSSLGRVWVVTLKEDLEWSDGKPITSSDVLFTITAIQNSDSGSPQTANWQGVTVERISEREVKFSLKSPYAYFLDNLKDLRIAPSHIFETIPVANLRLSNYNFEPVSSGPYTYSSFEKEKNGFISRYVLTANEAYAGSPALIKNFILKFFSTYNDAIFDFNHKGIDALGGLDTASVSDLKINHQLYQLPLPRYYAIFLNQSNHPALKDPVIRRALAVATDAEGIIEQVVAGYGAPAYGPLVPGIEGYTEALYSTEHFSLAEAAALLEKNKWLIGEGGIRTKTVGKVVQKLSFDLKVPNLPALVAVAEKLQADWEQIGIKLVVTTETPEQVHDSYIKSRSYQLLLFGNTLRGNSDMFSFWHSSQRSYPGLNLSLYSNKAVDAELERSRSLFDPVARMTSLAKIQKLIHDDRPAIFLFTPSYLYAAPRDLGGIATSTLTSTSQRFDTVNQWFLVTERIFK